MRLDQLLFSRGLFESRERARRAVMAGLVRVDGRLSDKPGTAVPEACEIEVATPPPFVSRAGGKLDEALQHFSVDATAACCLDVGASTGGFVDCLLQRGAARVIALDVGYGQLDASLRGDPRVVVMERVNARYLRPSDLDSPCDLVTVDVSFISLVKVVPALLPHLAKGGALLTLVKPQFEAGRGMVGKGGIVRDEVLRRRVIAGCVEALTGFALDLQGVMDCSVTGAGGNREAFALFRWPPAAPGGLGGG